jgi:glycosyltransferase
LKISLITATYNSIETLPTCMRSVATQTHKNIEHIIVDGCSNDGTVDFLKSSGFSYSILISEPDFGIYDALNKGLSIATGEIIGFLHSDDKLYHDRVLEIVSTQFRESKELQLVYSNLVYVSARFPEKITRRWLSQQYYPGMLSTGWMPPHPTMYLKAELYKKLGGFDSGMRISADYLSILRIFSIPEIKSKYIDDIFIAMREGGISNRNVQSLLVKWYEDFRSLRACGYGLTQCICIIAKKNLQKIVQIRIFSGDNLDP